MTTYKSEMIEFRAGRIVLTEAQWTANTNVYPEGIIAITRDGSNAGRTKVFDGVKYWSQLAYSSGGGGGAVGTDDVTNDSVIVGGATATEALDALAQNFDDNSSAITALSGNLTEMGGPYKVWEGYISQTGTGAPVLVATANTLGGVPVMAYTSVGEYTLTLTGAFPDAAKVFVSYPYSFLTSNDAFGCLVIFRANANRLDIKSTTNDGTLQEMDVQSTRSLSITIKVYP